jgi:hypothetical protein
MSAPFDGASLIFVRPRQVARVQAADKFQVDLHACQARANLQRAVELVQALRIAGAPLWLLVDNTRFDEDQGNTHAGGN